MDAIFEIDFLEKQKSSLCLPYALSKNRQEIDLEEKISIDIVFSDQTFGDSIIVASIKFIKYFSRKWASKNIKCHYYRGGGGCYTTSYLYIHIHIFIHAGKWQVWF